MHYSRQPSNRPAPATWVAGIRKNWDSLLAFSLAFLAVALNLGPGYFFLAAYLGGCGYIIRFALKR